MSFLICSSIGLRLYDYKLLLPHMNKYATVAVLFCYAMNVYICCRGSTSFHDFFNKRNFRFPNVYLLITSKYNSPLKPQVCMFHQKYKHTAYIVDCEYCECLTPWWELECMHKNYFCVSVAETAKLKSLSL